MSDISYDLVEGIKVCTLRFRFKEKYIQDNKSARGMHIIGDIIPSKLKVFIMIWVYITSVCHKICLYKDCSMVFHNPHFDFKIKDSNINNNNLKIDVFNFKKKNEGS
ncbi:hypothetical protein DICPUDRAFT_76696 [Dictyostelium purpureum]|uniref:Uncharacterized protein n=1 Tax=Dictyostelium purpureum TaxID=5786 RepID=F0ZEC9_DICPU|nr:uncharacterized protein DICPUDRAFT_76696 [Dictyostelium purpureum]EGC37666.1 hypothetical protein DICPUDRAFT_76696 [Dictyostelium purpureum]|eukprot:XP_003285770.1 hypothetical protein DICPUDRAFT_76696 [Dictyostelium purpureum]